MSIVDPGHDANILRQIFRYQRRALSLVLVRTIAWSGTIFIAGMGLSRFKIPGTLVLTIFISCFVVAYYLWHHYPRTHQVVRMIDERLSLKEGLVTVFQFRESQGRFVPLLINQISPRLTSASSRQIFPFKMPRVLLIWPLLLALLIVPAEKGPLRIFDFSQFQENVADLKVDADAPVQENVKNREGNVVSPHSNLGLRKENETVIPAQSGNEEGEDLKPSPTPRDRDMDSHLRGNEGELRAFSDKTLTPLQGTKDHKDINPAQAGIQAGEGLKPSHTTSAEVGIPIVTKMTGLGRAEVVQVLGRQDIPQEYKDYIKSYFDAIQEGGEVHGEQRRD